MKRLVFGMLLVAFLGCQRGHSQDTICLVTGVDFVTYNTTIVSDNVTYSLAPDSRNNNQSIPLSRVRSIKFHSGEIIAYQFNFDEFDTFIDTDSAYAVKMGLSKQQYLQWKMKREQHQNDIVNGLGFILFCPFCPLWIPY